MLIQLNSGFSLNRWIISSVRLSIYSNERSYFTRVRELSVSREYMRSLPHPLWLTNTLATRRMPMRITGYKTASIYRRYRIVDERDLKEARQSLNAYLETQPTTTVVAPIRKAVGE